MKKALFAVFSFLIFSSQIFADTNPKPFVIPELQSWKGSQGRFTPSGRIVVKGTKAVRQVAEAFVADYREMFGKTLSIVTGGAKKGDFIFTLDKAPALGAEGYRLHIDDQTLVAAGTTQGLYWGTRTLLQLSEQDVERTLPKGETTDIPQYKLRGFMLDCGRKYIPMSYLRNLVKVMSYYKMNTLQLHLNDNGFPQYFGNDWSKTQAAFRLESDYFPGLTAKDGSYTKREFMALQDWANENRVEIIPEIDVPAHTLAFTHFRPELASKEYGDDHLDLFKEATYTFLDSLFAEYLGGKQPVFKGKRFNIGTDEYSNATKEVREKFRAFTDRYIRYVESFGKQAVVWGALSHAYGETPVKSDNVIMNCWYNGFANPQEMKKQGYQLVSIPDMYVYIVPAAGYYYDYLNCESLYKSWTPARIGNQTFEERDPSLLGGMFAVWNDHPGNGITVKDIHHRLYPAMQTLAVKCWTGANTQLPFEEFDQKRLLLSEAPGVNELGTWGLEPKEVFMLSEVQPGMTLPCQEIGYDYSVTFTIDAVTEEKGTVLFSSPHAVFYLSDPLKGCLGFTREGYLNRFNYKLPHDKEVTVTIEGNHRMTRLLINGKEVDNLQPQTLYAFSETDRLHQQYGEKNLFEPKVYRVPKKGMMQYMSTLVFPLQKTGQFKSKITDLSVKNFISKE